MMRQTMAILRAGSTYNLYSQSVSQMTRAEMMTTTEPRASAKTCKNTPFIFSCVADLGLASSDLALSCEWPCDVYKAEKASVQRPFFQSLCSSYFELVGRIVLVVVHRSQLGKMSVTMLQVGMTVLEVRVSVGAVAVTMAVAVTFPSTMTVAVFCINRRILIKNDIVMIQ